MRGDQGECAGRAEMLDERDTERAAFFGVGGGAEFVEQDQRIRRDVERHLANVGDVRGEGAEVFLDGLVVADIGQHRGKDRELGFGGGHGQAGLRHQAEQAHGLQGHGLAAGVGAADQQRAAVAGEFERDGDGTLAAAAQHVGEQRVARVLEVEALAEAGNDAIEIVGELRLAEDQFEFCDGDQGLADGIAVGAQAVGHLEQDAVDLAHFLFGEAHEFVVEVDGLERFDKERVAAGTGGVDHAIDLAALSGNHRDDEALIADGDELLLQHAFLAVGAEEALERFVDGFFLALDIAAEAREGDAGVVGHAAVGQDLAIEFAQQGAKFADGGGAAAQQREALGGRGEVRLGVGGDIEQGEQLEDFLGLEPGAFDAEFVHRGLHVGDAAELDAQRGAAAAGLRMQGGVEVLNGFSRFGEGGVELRAVGERGHFFQFAFAERARDVAAYELPQRLRIRGLQRLSSR